jgi:hypothetical protein
MSWFGAMAIAPPTQLSWSPIWPMVEWLADVAGSIPSLRPCPPFPPPRSTIA